MCPGPLYLQSWNVFRFQIGFRLISRIIKVDTPAVPLRGFQVYGSSGAPTAVSIQVSLDRRARLLSCKKYCQRANLVRGQTRRLLFHRSGSQRLHNVFRGSTGDKEPWRYSILRVVMTNGTPLLIDLSARGIVHLLLLRRLDRVRGRSGRRFC